MIFSKKIINNIFATSVLISAVVAPLPTAAQVDEVGFKDVHKGAHYYDAVLDLAEREIIQGFADSTFKPNNNVTRGQTAKIITGILEIDLEDVKDPGFKDLSSSNEYYRPIAALVEAGVLTGYEDQTFKPGNPTTRAQMAKMIHLAFELQDVESIDSPFSDVSREDWHADYVESLRVHQITTGTTATTYSPNTFVTRGQLASFVIRSEAVISKRNLQVSTIAGNGSFNYIDGTVSRSAFRSPMGLATLKDGSILVADQHNHLIRQIQNDSVSTFAGIIFEQDSFGLPLGGLYNSEKDLSVFHEPTGITVDEADNVYIADAANHSIRKIAVDGQVSTVAGTGLIGDEDGIGESASFYLPQAIAVASDGTLYVADTLNHLIRKITKDGTVTTLNASPTRAVEVFPGVVELAGDFKDGPLSSAEFNEPSGLVLDSRGNLYVSDSANQLIRYIDFTTNTVSTVAGKIPNATSTSLYEAGGFADGQARAAEFNFPKGLALSEDGGLIIADSLNDSIRYLRNGKVWTIASDLNRPMDVAVNNEGTILFTDSDHQLVRQLTEEE